MPLFQSSVVTKYLKSQNEQEISEKWNVFKNQINQVDKEIDAMVYELYGLTQEEIEIVEKS